MSSGPVVVQVLEGEGAVLKNRDVMGATNPENAAEGTIRQEFGQSIEANSVHDQTLLRMRQGKFHFSLVILKLVG